MDHVEFQTYFRSLFINTHACRETECWQLRRMAWFIAEPTLFGEAQCITISELARAFYGADTRRTRNNVYRTLKRIDSQLWNHQGGKVPSHEIPHIELVKIRANHGPQHDAKGRSSIGYRIELNPPIKIYPPRENQLSSDPPTIIPSDFHSVAQTFLEMAIQVITRELISRKIISSHTLIPTTEVAIKVALDLLFDQEADFLSKRTRYFIPLTRVRVEMTNGKTTNFSIDAVNDKANELLGFDVTSTESIGLARKEALERVGSWMDQNDLTVLLADQDRTLRDYERGLNARARVPFKFNSTHPSRMFQSRSLLPRILSAQVARVSVSTEIHKAIVAYIDYGN